MYRIPILIALVAILATLTIGIATGGSSSAHAATVEMPQPTALDLDAVADDPLPAAPTLRNRWVPMPVCWLVKVVDYVERQIFGIVMRQPVYSVQHVCRIVNTWIEERWRNPFNYHPEFEGRMPTMGSERARCGYYYELC